MKDNTFWSRWLVAVSFISMVLGVVLALAPGVTHSTMGVFVYDTIAGEGAFAALTESDLAVQNMLYGILGAVMVSWMIVIGWLAYIPFRRGERWAWLAIGVSVFASFVIDSTVSATNGMPMNVLFNIGFLILFGIPLLATYRQFRPFGRLQTATA